MKEKAEKLLNRNFILLWQGMAFSVFGDVLYSIAIGIWVYQKTGSTAWMGIMSSISMFTAMFVMPFVGTLIDRWNKRNILVACDFIRGVLMLIVAAIAYFGNLNLELVLITALIAALCNVFFSPAALTMFALVVPPKDLVRAQSLSSGTSNLIGLIGKGISGVIVAVLGVPLIILINGISLLISAFSEIFIQLPPQPKAEEKFSIKHMFQGMKDGLNYVLKHRGLAVLMIGAMLCNLFFSGFHAMILPYCEMKGLDLTQYGLFVSVMSLAGLVGTLMMGILPIAPKTQPKLMFGAMILGNGPMGVALVMLNGFVPLTISVFLGQLMSAIGNAILNAAIIISIEEEMRGRVISILVPCSMGGQAISAIGYGFLAEIVGLYPIIIMGSLLSVTTFIMMTFSKDLWKTVTEGCVSAQ